MMIDISRMFHDVPNAVCYECLVLDGFAPTSSCLIAITSVANYCKCFNHCLVLYEELFLKVAGRLSDLITVTPYRRIFITAPAAPEHSKQMGIKVIEP